MSFQASLRWHLSLLLLIPVEEARAQRNGETPRFQTNAHIVLLPVTVTDHRPRRQDRAQERKGRTPNLKQIPQELVVYLVVELDFLRLHESAQ